MDDLFQIVVQQLDIIIDMLYLAANILMCTPHNFLCSKVRFIHTNTVTGSYSCSKKNYAYASRTSCCICIDSNTNELKQCLNMRFCKKTSKYRVNFLFHILYVLYSTNIKTLSNGFSISCGPTFSRHQHDFYRW